MKPVDAEIQLFQYLPMAFPEMSRNRLKRYLASGRILVNGTAVVRHDYLLNRGDRVEIGPAVAGGGQRHFSSPYLRIVYEDRHLFVIDKAPGILSMATSHHSFCIKDVLDDYLERTHQRCRAHVVHRLDRDTSGLMLFAKSRDVQQMFEADWKGLVYDRRYVSVVRGRMPQTEGTVRSWLTETKQFFTCSSPVDNGGKLAITHYRVLQQGPANSLVEARLDTGRKNQIRVHFSELGAPILGDNKYGPSGDDGLMVNRLFLHAYLLHFIHPVTGKRLQFDTPIPQRFLSAL
ncbi:MAG: RluA family pseudouridine synthase [Bacteroidaceae bacterium]|nr:RluA family pseudouridine synthase [Bacteroidaceae bacterium]